MADAVEVARRLAEDVLLPDAAAVDAADSIPAAHLAALDASGLTGLAPTDASFAERVDVTAALAGGCLATAFVWLQHQGALVAVARSAGAAARFAPDLAAGRLRAGLAITAVRPPDPLRLRGRGAERRLEGSAPWVTGWGLVDVLRVAAVDDDGRVASVLVDVDDRMRPEPLHLVAANASATVVLGFDGVPVPQDRLLDVVPAEEWGAASAAGLGANGALALGVGGRAATTAGSVGAGLAVRSARDALLAARTEELPAARARCSAAALRSATVLAVQEGGRGVLARSAADRLLREAHFLLAFGSRPAIREALLDRFGA